MTVTKKTIDIKGPPFKHVQLTLDKHAAPTYSQRIYIFALSEPEPIEAITDTLHAALQICVDTIPALGMIEYHGTPGPVNTRRIHNDDGTGALKLIINDMRPRADMAYSELSPDFPQHKFACQDLFPIAGFGSWPEESPTCFVQASFVKGGLLLGICVSHVVMDGSAISQFVTMLGSLCNDIQSGRTPKPTLSDKAFYAGVFKGLNSTGPMQSNGHAPTDGHADPDVVRKIEAVMKNHPGYRYFPDGMGGPPVAGSPWVLKNTAKLVQISSKSLNELVAEVRSVAPGVSKHDVVVALLWTTTVRAGEAIGRLKGDIAEVTIPLNVRRFEKLGVSPDFIGNAYYLMLCTVPKEEILSEKGVTIAAAAMRKTIENVTAEQIQEFYTVFDLAGERAWVWCFLPTLVGLIYDRWAGFFGTSHRYIDLDALDFGPLFGRVTSFRLPKEGVGGLLTVLPRASERLGDGFEISMEWDAPMWEQIEKDVLFKKYAKLID